MNTLLEFNAMAGLVIEGLLGIALFVWLVERILSFIYFRVQCSQAFVAFLWERRQSRK